PPVWGQVSKPKAHDIAGFYNLRKQLYFFVFCFKFIVWEFPFSVVAPV
ncbi:unnamed protein product, partial [marine sediment metagenome]